MRFQRLAREWTALEAELSVLLQRCGAVNDKAGAKDDWVFERHHLNRVHQHLVRFLSEARLQRLNELGVGERELLRRGAALEALQSHPKQALTVGRKQRLKSDKGRVAADLC